ncbi:hypothetical protein FHX08_004228 [Rhizobium sp. BK529]|uniref:hypothetical protein n=1 Tax=unclassified Rhizobium TaxID=2613769 RepID=UPI00180A8713|nr:MULTISPECIES: hypothetical protein [unclassified Rhizobium]MBB3593825.1 hypothetical protein [Rhizobium sp. BK529]
MSQTLRQVAKPPSGCALQLAEDHGISVVFMTANPEFIADGVRGRLALCKK